MPKEIFKKILVPYDGSEYSKKALDHAIEIAKNFDSSLFVITAVDTSDYPPGMLLALLKRDKRLEQAVAEYVTASKDRVRKELLAQVAVCKARGTNAYYDIITGGAVESILKFAKGRKMDLIVIGSQGLHGIKRLKSFGSVSRKVSEHASCPVMIVR